MDTKPPTGLRSIFSNLFGPETLAAANTMSQAMETHQERRAGLLRILTIAWIVFILIGLFAAVIRLGISVSEIIYIANLVVGIYVLRLNQRGKTRLAGYIFVISYNAILMIGFFFLVYTDPMTFSSALNIGVAYLMGLSVLLAALLIGGRAALQFAALNTLGLGLIFLMYTEVATLGTLGLLVTFVWLLALIAWLYERALERAFTRLKLVNDNLEKIIMIRTQELRRAKEQAESANRSKSAFLASMSHELRTPLNAILGFTQIIMRDSNLDSSHRQHMKIISNSGEHLLELINAVLEMSKIEAGQITLDENDFDLFLLLENLEDMLRPRVEGKGLEFVFERAHGLTRYIRTDERKLRQVLLNLISNATKFTYYGRITVHMRCEYYDQHVARFVFTVSDTGVGISEDQLKTIFESFSQTDSGRRAMEGTGLGLPISQEYVDLMGGTIQVSSVVNKGSTFTFDILAAVSSAEAIAPS
ncbi:MAG: hypothetical protein GYB67_04160, partial [Chloroflexi bacterium]|nr:hypothetical protein [Chloroflexota bacterium]